MKLTNFRGGDWALEGLLVVGYIGGHYRAVFSKFPQEPSLFPDNLRLGDITPAVASACMFYDLETAKIAGKAAQKLFGSGVITVHIVYAIRKLDCASWRADTNLVADRGLVSIRGYDSAWTPNSPEHYDLILSALAGIGYLSVKPMKQLLLL